MNLFIENGIYYFDLLRRKCNSIEELTQMKINKKDACTLLDGYKLYQTSIQNSIEQNLTKSQKSFHQWFKK